MRHRSLRLALALASGVALTASARAQGVVSGSVRDAGTRDPVAGARVELVGTALAATTGPQGRFTIRGVLPGGYTARALKLGFLPLELAVTVPAEGEVAPLDIQLVRVPTRLADVIVTPGHFGVMHEEVATQQTLSREAIQTRPQIGEDIYRSVNRLPGVASSDYSARFSVRGGSGDELLVLLDGLELTEPFHLKDLDASLSIIDVQAVGGVDLITGGFPAAYGDRLTGVFEMETVDPPEEDARSSVGISFTNARAMSQGRFAGGAGAWLVSARRGYLDLVLKMIDNTDDISPEYYDVLAKTEMRFGTKHVVGAHVLHAGDRLVFKEDESRIESRYGNSYGWLTWQARITTRLTAQTVASAGRLTWRRTGRDFQQGAQIFALADDRRFVFGGLKQDWVFEAGERALLKWGVDVRALDADYAYFNWRRLLSLENGQRMTRYDTTSTRVAPAGHRLGAYLAQRVRPRAGLTLEGGLRFDRQSYTGENRLDPRLNLALALGSRTTLRGAWGRYSQAQGIHELAVADGDTTFDEADVAEHRVVGVERVLGPGVRLRLEAYQRLMPKLRPRFVTLSNELDVFPEARTDRIRLTPTRADSRGVELFVQRGGAGRLEWTGSYALARVEDEVMGSWVPRAVDQRHTVYLDAGYRPGAKWRLGAAWQYHSGWPITDIAFRLATLDDGTRIMVSEAEALYAQRLPAYHRLDVRATRYFDLRHGRLALFLDVFNFYDHKNVIGYEYDLSLRGDELVARRVPTTMLPRLPSIGASWEF